MKNILQTPVRRRQVLTGSLALAGGAAAVTLNRAKPAGATSHDGDDEGIDHSSHYHGDDNSHGSGRHGDMITVGDVGTEINGFDPTDLLTDWEVGTVTKGADGQTIRSFTVTAEDREIEIAPGVTFPAWTFNGRVPGPTLRATEGDQLRIKFVNNGSHPHSMHFHGIHGASMDGLQGSGLIDPGDEFTYEFTAKPFGCHLYHCHAFPLRAHMHKGMYGAFIVDPDPAKHTEGFSVANSRLLGSPENANWQEFIMVMNAFDTNFDGANEFYMVNSVAHHYMKHPIVVDRAKKIRVYLINATEFDPINSFHLHANFFDYYDHGTTLTPTLKTVDTIMQCQAQRGIIEIDFSEHEPGMYMFHAHQSEFAELGWMSMFDVKDLG